MHIAPYDNQNKPIVDAGDPSVPLNYFNIVKLKKGEAFEYQVPGYETCVVPASTPWSDFRDLYMEAWLGGAKGITTFTDGGKRAGILKDTSDEPEDKAVACKWDPETGQKSCE